MSFSFFGSAIAGTRSESFDRDPKWEGFENRKTVEKFPTVVQDFGYANGAIGGQVWRTTTPAWYAAKVDATMEQPLSMEIKFKLTRTGTSAGVLFGFFNSEDLPVAGRPKQSLAAYFAGRRDDAIIHVRAYNGANEGSGTPVPPAENKRVQRGFPADGSMHRLVVDYDATAKKITAQLDDQPAGVANLAEFKSAGVRFDRFGLLNMSKAGSPMNISFVAIKYNGTSVDLSKDPGWDARGNHATFEEHDLGGVQAYGFAETNLAGGKAGEMGGVLWRSPKPSYYGDVVGPFSFDQPLEAHGTICMAAGTPDSGALLGFFNAEAIKKGEMKNFIGVQIEGPTRIGHYFRPYLLNSAGNKQTTDHALVLLPDSKPRQWSFSYDPARNGTVTVKLDDKTSKIELPAKLRAAGVKVDHFGIFPPIVGGNQVRIFIDDVTYTSSR